MAAKKRQIIYNDERVMSILSVYENLKPYAAPHGKKEGVMMELARSLQDFPSFVQQEEHVEALNAKEIADKVEGKVAKLLKEFKSKYLGEHANLSGDSELTEIDDSLRRIAEEIDCVKARKDLEKGENLAKQQEMRQMEIGLGMVGEHSNPICFGEAVSDEDEEGGEEIEEGGVSAVVSTEKPPKQRGFKQIGLKSSSSDPLMMMIESLTATKLKRDEDKDKKRAREKEREMREMEDRKEAKEAAAVQTEAARQQALYFSMMIEGEVKKRKREREIEEDEKIRQRNEIFDIEKYKDNLLREI